MNSETYLIADDHPLFRAALRQALAQYNPDAAVHETDSLGGVQDLLAAHRDVDLLLLDLHMPGVNGFSGLAYLRGRHPDIPVVMVSANEDRSVIQKARQQGASGFVPKSSSIGTIGQAIGAVMAGGVWFPEDVLDNSSQAMERPEGLEQRVADLTPAQFRVLQMIADGLLNKQIAYELEVTEATVKAHVTAIMKKLGVRTRTQAVLALNRLSVDSPHRL